MRRFSVSVALSVLYGRRAPQITTKEASDFFYSEYLYERIIDPGAQPPVDMLPILKYVPEWMGASWKGLCRELRTLRRQLFMGLLHSVESRNAKGEVTNSCVEIINGKAKEVGLTREMVG
jgi:hypothetical protein